MFTQYPSTRTSGLRVHRLCVAVHTAELFPKASFFFLRLQHCNTNTKPILPVTAILRSTNSPKELGGVVCWLRHSLLGPFASVGRLHLPVGKSNVEQVVMSCRSRGQIGWMCSTGSTQYLHINNVGAWRVEVRFGSGVSQSRELIIRSKHLVIGDQTMAGVNVLRCISIYAVMSDDAYGNGMSSIVRLEYTLVTISDLQRW